mmetsp:Transcript_139/g.418  ORF Transcript_139/g.418 Transcript_139/m.418 type:complete len:555 (+) Transcript_139:57-1721(+)
MCEGKNLLPKSKKVGDSSGSRPELHERFGLNAFLNDLKNVHSGSVPVSLVIAIVIGVICGVAAWLYYTLLEVFLKFFWKTLPRAVVENNPAWPESLYWLWIPIVCLFFSFLVGFAIVKLGFPGDLAYTVKCVHELGYVDMGHTPSMLVASQCSILAGASLGPEAPLVAICASIAGWVSRNLFKQSIKNVVRKHTLCGMACALAAFFGVPLGGSLFALEINHRLGYEYVEHAMVAVASGTTCIIVFRALAGLPIGAIWKIQEAPLELASASLVCVGALLGLFGAGLAALFAFGHDKLGKLVSRRNLGGKPIVLALCGGTMIALLGVLVPQSMFWGEFELQSIATLGKTPLAHIWPTTGLTHFQLDSGAACLIAGFTKLVAISFTVWGGFRGGYIFPFFCAGAAFGRAVTFLFPSLSPVVACLCIAAGINVAITRTAFSSSIILVSLSGEANAAAPIIAASLVSIFATYYMPFIRAQQGRCELLESQLHAYRVDNLIDEAEAKARKPGFSYGDSKADRAVTYNSINAEDGDEVGYNPSCESLDRNTSAVSAVEAEH